MNYSHTYDPENELKVISEFYNLKKFKEDTIKNHLSWVVEARDEFCNSNEYNVILRAPYNWHGEYSKYIINNQIYNDLASSGFKLVNYGLFCHLVIHPITRGKNISYWCKVRCGQYGRTRGTMKKEEPYIYKYYKKYDYNIIHEDTLYDSSKINALKFFIDKLAQDLGFEFLINLRDDINVQSHRTVF